MRACLSIRGYVVGGLVNHIHQNGGKVCYHEDAQKVSWEKPHLSFLQRLFFKYSAFLLAMIF